MQREREEDHNQESKDSPSFRLLEMDSPERISAEVASDDSHVDHEIEVDNDFDFSFLRIPEARSPIAAADDIFSDGKIRPIYPIFNRDLLLNLSLDDEALTLKKEVESPKSIRLPLRRLFIEEEREQASSFSSTSSSSSASSSSASLDELAGIAPETYCVWAPPGKKERGKKSSSTGLSSSSTSLSRRWRLRDLVVGRSQSDGKEKFVFIPIREEEEVKTELGKGKKKSATTTEVDAATAQRRMYGQSAGRRKSFLPYRQDLVGFFASVNGLSRTHHNPNPF